MPAAGVLGFDSGQLSLSINLTSNRTTPPRSPFPCSPEEPDEKTCTLYRSAFAPGLQVGGHLRVLKEIVLFFPHQPPVTAPDGPQ